MPAFSKRNEHKSQASSPLKINFIESQSFILIKYKNLKQAKVCLLFCVFGTEMSEETNEPNKKKLMRKGNQTVNSQFKSMNKSERASSMAKN